MATYYISTSGSNSNNGLTTSTPWLTLAYAESTATTAGDIIALKRGDTFYLADKLRVNQVGTDTNHIIWDGSLWGTGAKATITASVNAIYIFALNQCSHLTFQNIIFNGQNRENSAIVIGGPYYNQSNENDIIIQDCEFYDIGTGDSIYAILVETQYNNISNIIVRRNIIDGVGQCGIGFYCGRSNMGATPAETSNIYIGYNQVYNYSKSYTGEAILLNNKITGAIIEHNICHYGADDNMGFGLVIASGEPNAGWYPTGVVVRYNEFRTYNQPACYIQSGGTFDVKLYYNKFYRHTHDGSIHNACVSTSPDLRSFSGSNFEFYNNTVVVNHNSSYCFGNSASDAGLWVLKNNIFYHTGTPAMCTIYSYRTIGAHINNLYFGGGSNFASINGTTYNSTTISTWEVTCQKTNPLLTNTAGFDWHLLIGSPCINSGTNVSLTEDYEGNVVVSPPSIGAYEYGSNPPTTSSLTIGSTPITDIKIGSTQITKVIRNDITYWQV